MYARGVSCASPQKGSEVESERQELWTNGFKLKGKTPGTELEERRANLSGLSEHFSPDVGGSFTDISVLNVSSGLRWTELRADKA